MLLDGRSYTGLMALQPGVVPISTSENGTIVPANNAFNHAQFAGVNNADGNFNDGPPVIVNGQNRGGTFGMIGGNDGGRIGELAVKLTF